MNQIEHFVIFLWNCFAVWSCRREVQSSKWCLAWHEGPHILGGTYCMLSVITALSFNSEVPRSLLETMWTCITHDMLSPQHPDSLIADNTDSNIWHYTTMGSKFGLLSPITCLGCSFYQSSEASLSYILFPYFRFRWECAWAAWGPPAFIPVCDIACVTMKHQSISKWLSQLGLPQYCVVLEQEYDGVEVKSKET